MLTVAAFACKDAITMKNNDSTRPAPMTSADAKAAWDARTDSSLVSRYSWECSLTEGDLVFALWTNSHRHHGAICRVVRVNAKSLRLAIAEDSADGYPTDWKITLPREHGQTWRHNNSVMPIVRATTTNTQIAYLAQLGISA